MCHPYSHSMILDHGNALIFQRKFFLRTVKTRPTSRQISSVLISKGNLRVSDSARLRQLSTTIGRFFRFIDHAARRATEQKIPSAAPIARSASLAIGSHRSLSLMPPGRDEGVIVCITDRLLGRKSVLDRLR